MIDRRRFIGGATASGAGALLPAWARAATAELGFAELPAGQVSAQALEALPGKVALIRKSYRPPNYETPVEYLGDVYTRNDAFFVRWHLANIPEVKADQWRLNVGGDAAERSVSFTLQELKTQFQQTEVVAVCQCSGNRRGLFEPHVPGVIWGPGAMGNARWRGVRLKDVLARAGVKKEAVEISFDGADAGAIAATPDFVKSLPPWKALDDDTLIAFEMNGAPLPHLNGYPARLIVPGWTATYWVKQLTDIAVLAKPFTGFWMATAYRVPVGKFPTVDRFITQETAVNTPITQMVTNSLITNLRVGQRVNAAQGLEVRGVAWDAGSGIVAVDVSLDGGASWQRSALGENVGRYSFRTFALRVPKLAPGNYEVLARAESANGTTQTFTLIHNPAGYHHNVVQRIPIVAA